MSTAGKKVFCLSFAMYLLLILTCPLSVLGSHSGALVIDEDTDQVSMMGYVDEYVPGMDEAYIVIPAQDKTYADFASSDTSEELLSNTAYLGAVPVSSSGRYSTSFAVPGVEASQDVYLLYNGTDVNLNSVAAENEITCSLVIDDTSGMIAMMGYVSNYVQGIDEAYIVIPAEGKTYEDFASSETSEALFLNSSYIGAVPVSASGRFSTSFTVPGIDAERPIYLSYNGTNVNVNSDEVSSSVMEKSLHITDSVEYAEGYNTLQIKILKYGYTYEDYLSLGNSVVFGTYDNIAVEEDGAYEFELADAKALFGDNVVIITYAGEDTHRIIRNGEFTVSLYVDAAYGNDSNNGLSRYQPLKTIDAAQALYNEKCASDGYSGEVLIYSGEYGTVELTVNPPEGATLTYKGAEGEEVVMSAATKLSFSDFSKVSDPTVLSRIKDTAKNNVYELNLGEYGITASDILGDPTSYSGSNDLTMAALYLNGKPQSISRWPNGGYADVSYAEVEVDADSDTYIYSFDAADAVNWGSAGKNMYLEGFFSPSSRSWCRSYANVAEIDTANGKVIFDAPQAYKATAVDTTNTRSGKVTVCHLLEEIDIPGEWYIDTDTMTLYYFMPSGLTSADELIIASSDTPVIAGKDVSGIGFENINIIGSRGPLVHFENADDMAIRNCVISGGQYGVVLDGRNNVIDGNAIYYTKGNGVWVEFGADDTTLTPSANKITNNHIYNCGTAGIHGGNTADAAVRIGKSSSRNTTIGDVIENNVIHGNPYGEAVIYTGMDHSIKYNEFYNMARYMSDVGVVYTGAKLNQYGTHTDYNYIHDFSHLLRSDTGYSTAAIYWDDWHSGQIAENNIIVSDGDASSRGLLEVGKNNTANYNMVINAYRGMTFSDRNSISFYDSCYGTFDYVTDAIDGKYPQILQSKADIDTAIDNGDGTYSPWFYPTGNQAHGNLHVDVTRVDSDATVFTEAGSHTYDFNIKTSQATNTVSTNSNNITSALTTGDYSDIFVDHENHDWRLKRSFVNSYEGLLSSNLITEDNFDMDAIGLQHNVYDASNPADTSFKLTYPLNTVFESVDTVSLAWERALFADRYYYEISTAEDFSVPVYSGYTMDNAADISSLDVNTRYYWRVTAYNDSKEMGDSWSSVQDSGTFVIREMEYEVQNVKFFNAEDEQITQLADISTASYATYDVINETSEMVNYDMYMALYNADGSVMKHVMLVKPNESSDPGTVNHQATVSVPAAENCSADDIIYIFLWDETGSLKPIAKKTIIR